MIRRVERRRICNDDKDPEILTERPSILLLQTKSQCYAWIFIPGHAHFLKKNVFIRHLLFHEKSDNGLSCVLRQKTQMLGSPFTLDKIAGRK